MYNKYSLILYLLSFSSILIQAQKSHTVPTDTTYKQRNIRLKEVVVTATIPDKPGTSAVIDQEAIGHIQAADLSDIIQLLPGALTLNPNLNAPSKITIRSIDPYDQTNALGTAIVIDGIRANNNTNLQLTTLSSQNNYINNSSVNSGFDIRTLSPAHIESVEVISGVPSAKYGDVTSGMVLVKTKAGANPFNAAFRMTSREKLVSAGKGWLLKQNRGTLHLGADYGLSLEDPRSSNSFNRIGLQAAYSTVFNQTHTPVSFHVNLRGSMGIDKEDGLINKIPDEYQKGKNQELTLGISGRWQINKSWITDLEYQAGFSYAYQLTETNEYISGVQSATTSTITPGEQTGYFVLPNYFSLLKIEGTPISLQSSLIANWRHTLGCVSNKASIGIEWNSEGNRGDGVQFDPLKPPVFFNRYRPRSYTEIPFLHRYVAFAEEQAMVPLGNTRLEVQAGVRLTNIQTPAIQYPVSAEPRFNLRYILADHPANTPLSRFSVRAGWGLLRKMPLLSYLYPDKIYNDNNNFTYSDPESGYQLAVLTTQVTDITNKQLRIPVNRKLELGINMRIAGITADVVWFSEHLKDGYQTIRQATPFEYKKYDALIDPGARPEYSNGMLTNNKQPIGYVTDQTFNTFKTPGNETEQKKQGVEYTLDFGQCEAIRTSLIINGAFYSIQNKNAAIAANYPSKQINGKSYPYVGFYETASISHNATKQQRFNSNFRFITHIPEVSLITTLTIQAVWLDKTNYRMESNYNNPMYLADNDGNRIAGDPHRDTEHNKHLNPLYYMDTAGKYHEFTQEMESDPRFSDLVLKSNGTNTFRGNSFSPYFLLNLRITKEIGQYVSVAFCANNFTQSNPQKYSNNTGNYQIMNPNLYYGAELNIRF